MRKEDPRISVVWNFISSVRKYYGQRVLCDEPYCKKRDDKKCDGFSYHAVWADGVGIYPGESPWAGVVICGAKVVKATRTNKEFPKLGVEKIELNKRRNLK